MRKMLIIIIAVLATSCECPWGFHIKYDDPFFGLPAVATVNEAWSISESVKYVPDTEELYKEPRDTYVDMTGDCEDIAALFLAIVINSGLGDGTIAIIKVGDYGHALVHMDGLLYEAQEVGKFYPPSTPIVKELSLTQYIWHKGIL